MEEKNTIEEKKPIEETPKVVSSGKPSSKKMTVVLLVLIVLIVIVGFLFLKEEKEEKKPVKKTEVESEQTFKAKTGYDERLRKTIQADNYNNGRGDIYEGYRYNDEYYLTLNQSGFYAYNDTFPGDIVLWVKEKNGKVETKQLNNGDKPTNIVEINDSPYIKQDGRTYFIYYENNGNPEMNFLADGYVYEVKKDGEIKLHYETKGHFHSLKKDKNGKLILIEKVFTDTRNMYPDELKPYKLKSYRLDKHEWVFVDEKEVQPTEKTEKEDGA